MQAESLDSVLPVTITYNPNAESIEVCNGAEGNTALDPPADPPLSDLVCIQ